MLSRAPKRSVPTILTQVQLDEIYTWIQSDTEVTPTEINERYTDIVMAKAAESMQLFLTADLFAEVRKLCDATQLADITKAHATAPFSSAREAKTYLQTHYGNRRRTTSVLPNGSGTLRIVDPIDGILRYVSSTHCKSYTDIADTYNTATEAEDKLQAIRAFQALKDMSDEYAYFRPYRDDPAVRMKVAKAHVTKNFKTAAEVERYLQVQRNLESMPKGRGSEYLSFSPLVTPDGQVSLRDLLVSSDSSNRSDTGSNKSQPRSDASDGSDDDKSHAANPPIMRRPTFNAE